MASSKHAFNIGTTFQGITSLEKECIHCSWKVTCWAFGMSGYSQWTTMLDSAEISNGPGAVSEVNWRWSHSNKGFWYIWPLVETNTELLMHFWLELSRCEFSKFDSDTEWPIAIHQRSASQQSRLNHWVTDFSLKIFNKLPRAQLPNRLPPDQCLAYIVNDSISTTRDPITWTGIVDGIPIVGTIVTIPFGAIMPTDGFDIYILPR